MSQSEEKNNNTRIILIIVAVVALLLCCCGAAGVATVTRHLIGERGLDIEFGELHGSTVGRQQANREMHERFSVSSAPRVVIENDVGSIAVTGSDEDEIVVYANARAWGANRELAEAAAEQIEVLIEMQDDGALYVTAILPRVQMRGKSPQVEIEVVVPCASEIEIINKVGEIRLRDMAGACAVHSEVGSVEVDYIDIVGDNVIETQVGSIDVRLCEDCDCYLFAKTGVGEIDCDATTSSMSSRRRGPGDALECELGDDPDASLTLNSATGSIKVRKDD